MHWFHHPPTHPPTHKSTPRDPANAFPSHPSLAGGVWSVAAGCWDGDVCIVDLDTTTVAQQVLLCPGKMVGSVAYSPCGSSHVMPTDTPTHRSRKSGAERLKVLMGCGLVQTQGLSTGERARTQGPGPHRMYCTYSILPTRPLAARPPRECTYCTHTRTVHCTTF